MQIKIYLEFFGEFLNTHIDGENDNCENFQDAKGSEEEIVENRKFKNSLGGRI